MSEMCQIIAKGFPLIGSMDFYEYGSVGCIQTHTYFSTQIQKWEEYCMSALAATAIKNETNAAKYAYTHTFVLFDTYKCLLIGARTIRDI